MSEKVVDHSKAIGMGEAGLGSEPQRLDLPLGNRGWEDAVLPELRRSIWRPTGSSSITASTSFRAVTQHGDNLAQ